MEKVIRVFHSFEEADAADEDFRARLTPAERVEIFFQIREREHGPQPRLERVYRVLELEQR